MTRNSYKLLLLGNELPCSQNLVRRLRSGFINNSYLPLSKRYKLKSSTPLPWKGTLSEPLQNFLVIDIQHGCPILLHDDELALVEGIGAIEIMKP